MASKHKKRRQPGLSRYEENRIRTHLLKHYPSSAWVDAVFMQLVDQSADGNEVIYRFHNEKSFPPGGADSLMALCPICGRMSPVTTHEREMDRKKVEIELPSGEKWQIKILYYTGNIGCADCQLNQIQEAYGHSPSATAIQTIRMRKLRVESMTLRPEDGAALRREIRRFGKQKIKNKVAKNQGNYHGEDN